MTHGPISIWFMVGVSMLVNGLLITGSGIYQWLHPPENPVVLFHLHAPIWWGGLLAIFGAIYCWKFSPSRAVAGTKRAER